MSQNSLNYEPAGAADAPGVPVIDSNELLAPSGELAIMHAGETYRLRKTRKGGLILTK